MNKFPLSFNKDANFEDLRDQLHLKTLRERVYNHYLTHGDKVFFDYTKEKKFEYNIDIIIKELEELGFKTKKMYGNTSLLIWLNDDNVRIWLDNQLI